MKLLIVDDSNIIRSRISRIVSEAPELGLQVVGVAENGKEALELFKIHKPELVTMDLTMPELDGVACTSEILATSPSCKVIIISALADKATAIEALKRGALGFIYKPFDEEELKDALVELMEDRTE